MNECVRQKGFDPKAVKETLNRWIAGEVERTAAAVTAGIEAYKFNEAAGAIYEFIWGTFCDWYLELIKPMLNGDDEAAKAETRATTAWVLDQILKLLHPFMPFITEELWARLVEVGRRAREPAVPRAPGRCSTGLADRGSRRGDRLARQARQRGALGALGDERAGRRQDPAGAGRRRQGRARARRASRGHDQAAGAARCASRLPRRAPKGCGADRASARRRPRCRWPA